MKTINEQWKEFAISVLPDNPSKLQEREMKRAFFGGFASGIASYVEAKELKGEAEEEKQIDSYFAQVKRFMVAIELGEA